MHNSDFPTYRGRMEYVCLSCGQRYPADSLLYTCPQCGGVFLLENTDFAHLRTTDGPTWRKRFDSRAAARSTALRGIFRYYELMAPVMDEEDIVYLGEGITPIVEAAAPLRDQVGIPFAYKNDGQNPSASFKDRGMACAFSYLKWLCRRNDWEEVLTVCASTGDTSAAAALYASYVGAPLKSVVLLPHGKVTPQQLSQPLGSGATVLELPGVFDDCMKVVELLAENYRVALLNSKNSWRILGQESYAYEVAQWYNWDVDGLCLFVPVGNAGNITAIMSGFLKMHDLGIITSLPRIFGVQSSHADPVYRYYAAPEGERVWQPVDVRPSVAQAVGLSPCIRLARSTVSRAVTAEIFTKPSAVTALTIWSISSTSPANNKDPAGPRHRALRADADVLKALPPQLGHDQLRLVRILGVLLVRAEVQVTLLPLEDIHAVAQRPGGGVEAAAPEAEDIVRLVDGDASVHGAQKFRRAQIEDEEPAGPDKKPQPPEALAKLLKGHVAEGVERGVRRVHRAVEVELSRPLADEERRRPAGGVGLLPRGHEHLLAGVGGNHVVAPGGHEERERARPAAEVKQQPEFPAVRAKERLVEIREAPVIHVARELVIPGGQGVVSAHSSSLSAPPNFPAAFSRSKATA